MAAMTRGSPWPMLSAISWLLKSMNRVPSGVQKKTPFARATGSGSTVPCAAHSEIVCCFEGDDLRPFHRGPALRHQRTVSGCVACQQAAARRANPAHHQ